MSSLASEEEIWRKYDEVEQRLTASISERMLNLAKLEPGMPVIDIATGRGEPAVRAARRVGQTGFVFGIDVSGPMLRMARERADHEGVATFELNMKTPSRSAICRYRVSP